MALRSSFVRVFLLLLVAAGAGAAQAPRAAEEPPPRVLVLRAGTVIADPTADPIDGGAVVIRGDTIAEVGPASSVSVPEGARVVDLGERTLLPGLVDAHTHLDTGTLPSSRDVPSLPLATLRAARGLERALGVGVTTMRVVGSFGFMDVALRDAVREGTVVGPRIVPAGHALGIPGGHTDFLAFPPEIEIRDLYTPRNGYFSGPDEAREAVQLQLKYGAEVIKVTASGGVGSPLDAPDQEQVSEAELRAIADMAHRMGRRVTAHAENAGSNKAALRAGFDSIDHASELDDEAIELLRATGAYVVPTLFIVDFINTQGEEVGMPEFMLRKARALARSHMASYEKALAAGVRIAAGSDMSYAPERGTLIDELETQVKYGMSPRDALASATVAGAACLGLEEEIGTIAKGKKADLVAVEGDPFESIAALEHVRLVLRDGRILVSRIEGVATEGPARPSRRGPRRR